MMWKYTRAHLSKKMLYPQEHDTHKKGLELFQRRVQAMVKMEDLATYLLPTFFVVIHGFVYPVIQDRYN